MSIKRARKAVLESRDAIDEQIDDFANRAGVDRLTMVRALQEELSQELNDHYDETRRVSLELEGTLELTVNSQKELEFEIDRVRENIKSLGVVDIVIYDNGGYDEGDEVDEVDDV
jgi:recombinational DNA repair ATPase RecF